MKCISFLGKAALMAAAALVVTLPVFSQITLRNALDADGDGKADPMIFRPASGTWWRYHSGNGGLSVQQFGMANQDFMTPGDYDGDGKGDIAVWRDTTGVWWWFRSSDNTARAVQFGATGDEPVARDYDGDGITDHAVVRRSNGVMVWYVLRSTDSGYHAVQFGAATDFVAPGDYDGDGKFDLAVQRPGATPTSSATWFIALSSGGFNIFQFGFSSDLIVPGDYDGDGKTDVAVVREGSTPQSPLVWFILQSSNGQALAVQWGVTGTDLTVQNDYDGDGKTDIAVWRNSNGTYYIRNSTTGNMSVFQWGSPSDFPIAGYDTH